jgi:strictosidine synthase-like protein
MINKIISAFERFRGGWSTAVSIPLMDGALRPNNVLEDSPAVLSVEAPDNLAFDGERILFSSGSAVFELKDFDGSAKKERIAEFGLPISCLAAFGDGSIAVGLSDGRVLLQGGAHNGLILSSVGDRPIVCPTAALFADAHTLFVCLGSRQHSPQDWKYDLMERNASGSVWRVDLTNEESTCFADRLAFPYGIVAPRDGSLVVSESWRHQLIAIKIGLEPEIILDNIQGYPARIYPVANGDGVWLSVFAPRNQLIEFVLRESKFRSVMMKELDPEYWIAPSLGRVRSFLEPMQGGALIRLGRIKPWAPSRSYGLVIGLDSNYRPKTSFHSRADGMRHGITSCLEIGGKVLATSKGDNVIVAIDLASHEEE